MLQNIKLRGHITLFLQTIPKITYKVLKIFNLLMFSGSKSSEDKDSKIKSIRIESMKILLNIVLFANEDNDMSIEFDETTIIDNNMNNYRNENKKKSSQTALNLLLWATTADDFEIRSRVIASLIRYLIGFYHVHIFMNMNILLFINY